MFFETGDFSFLFFHALFERCPRKTRCRQGRSASRFNPPIHLRTRFAAAGESPGVQEPIATILTIFAVGQRIRGTHGAELLFRIAAFA